MVKEQNENITNSLMGRQKKFWIIPWKRIFSPAVLVKLFFLLLFFCFYDNGLNQLALPDMWEEMADLQGNVRIGGMNS